MSDDRHVQEGQAETRHTEIIEASRDAKARVLEGLAALNRELEKVQRAAEALPTGLPSRPPRRGFWPWFRM